MKVLLVEDNRGDAGLIQEMLSEVATEQFELVHAESMEAALTYLGEASTDVILLDLSLPDSHGLDTFAKIRDRAPATPVVVLSGFADEAFALEAVHQGAQDYLSKSETNSNLLVRALRYAVERARVEEALREKEEKLRFIFQSMGDMIVVMDLKGDIVDVNESTVRTLGYKDKNELIGRNSAELVVEEYRDAGVDMAIKAIKKGLQDDRPEYQHLRLKTSSGGELQVEYGINLIRDATGSVRGVLGIGRDITERKLQEQALQASEEKLRTMFESVGEAIIVTDTDGKILEVNDVAPELSGYSKKELVGRNAISLIAPRAYDMIIQQMRKNLKDKSGLKQFQCSFIRADGTEIEAEFSSSPLLDKSGNLSGFVTVARDVTARKQAEATIMRRNRELSAMNIIAQSLSEHQRLNEVLKTALESTLKVMGLPAGGIWLIDENASTLKLTVQRGFSPDFARDAHKLPLDTSATGRAATTGHIARSSDLNSDDRVAEVHERFSASGELQPLLSIPLRSKGKTLGVMNVFDYQPCKFTAEDLPLIETLGNEIGVAIENARLLEQLEEISITDKLTGLYNRRHFYEVLESEINRTQRYGHSFSLVIIDLDGFKKYNDSFGHLSGDKVLQGFANALKSTIRKTDTAYRYGGDEFAIILPSTDSVKARKLIDRLRSHWPDNIEGAADTDIVLGFSAGIAQSPGDAETPDGLVSMADAALYKAKREGKYRTELASEMESASNH